MRPARRQPRLSHGWIRPLVLVLSLAFLASAALGGTVFVWCAPMARAMLHACCPSTAPHEAVIASPCCEGHQIAALPDGTTGTTVDVWIPPAPLVAVIALALLYTTAMSSVSTPLRLRMHPARAGPHVPLFLRHRTLRN